MQNEIKFSTSILNHISIPDFLEWLIWALSPTQSNIDIRSYAQTIMNDCQDKIKKHPLQITHNWPKTITPTKLKTLYAEEYRGLEDLIKIISDIRTKYKDDAEKFAVIGKDFLLVQEYDEETKKRWISNNEVIIKTSAHKIEAIERVIAYMVSDLSRSGMFTFEEISTKVRLSCQRATMSVYRPTEVTGTPETTAGDSVTNEYL